MIGGNLMQSIAEVSKDQSVASNEMMEAINLWTAMYLGSADKLDEEVETLGLPAIIASEIARSVTLEMKVKVTGSEMADFLDGELEDVRRHIRPNTEYACATGGIVFKPYVNDDGLTIEIVRADTFYPISFNNSGKITGAYFLYRHWEGKKVFSRLERHELKGDVYSITNTAYVSTDASSLGRECSLSSVPDWEDIEPEVTINGLESPLFSYFKVPIGNTVDVNSPLGVSVFSRAVSLIRDTDKQYRRFLWEYEGGELAIDASSDAFRFVGGQPLLPEGKERLYRMNNLDPQDSTTELFKAWSPALRDTNYMAGMNRLLLQIEDACSLSRGTLSDPSQEARTATEIRILKQRSYILVSDIQTSLENALDDLIYAMYSLAVLYDLAPDGKFETNYTWDDSIIIDAETERIRDQQEVAQGLMNKYEYRMKWYGESEEEAKAKLGEVQELSDEMILGMEEPEPEDGAVETPKGKEPEEEEEDEE